MFVTVALGYLALVKSVPYCLVWQLRNTRYACHVVQFVNNPRVNGESLTPRNILGNTQRYQRPQVTGMVQTRVLGVFYYFVVQLIDTALNRFQQSAATYYNIEFHVEPLSPYLLHEFVFTVVELVHDVRVPTQFLVGVVYAGMHNNIFVDKDTHLGRYHSWIYS